MIPAELTLAIIRRTLREIARQGDGERLRRLLRGQELPALGGGEEPAERIVQALELPPYDADLTHRIGHLCADSAKLWLERLTEREGPGAAGDESFTYNLLLLASWLPRDAELFAALYPYHASKPALSLLVAGFGRGARQLRRALCNQQTDARLQDYWLSLLRGSEAGSPGSPGDAARRSELLEAWRGILWLPRPSASGPPLDLAAMDEGLRLLSGAVAGPLEDQGREIMRDAFYCMTEAIPLDPTTWVELIKPYRPHWPEPLQEVAAETWPVPEPRLPTDPPRLPANLAELWEAFDGDTRSAIREALNRDDAEAGRRLLNDLAFSPPQIAGLPPQERRRRILDLEHRLWPSAKAQPAVETLHDGRDRRKKPKPAKAKTTKRIDRQAALEAINRGLAGVEQCLRRGDEAKARRYLDGLVKNQAAQGLPDTPVHIAKTLSKAAVLAQNAGYLEWAERLQREACRHNREDPVAANGLADILKSRGELDAAEQQYRANMTRWPNNEVAANGLAEVLKSRGELEAAEVQYRANIERWPNNEVAANGLAEVLKARGELEAAEQQYRDSIARWPNNEVAASGLADVLKSRGELDAAEQQYRDSMAHWPNNAVAASGLAEVLKSRGDLEAAEQQYRANMARWPNDEVARHGLANVLRKRRRHAEALQLLPNPLQPVTAHDLYHLHLRGMILLELGRGDEALDAFRRGLAAANLPVYQAAFRHGLVLMDLSQGNFPAAQRRLRELPGDIPQLNVYRLHAAAGQGNEAEARTLRTSLDAHKLYLDITTRRVLELVVEAYCLESGIGPRKPDEATHREIIDAEIEMAQAAFTLWASSFLPRQKHIPTSR